MLNRKAPYTVPYASPLYGAPPYDMVEGKILVVTFDSANQSALRTSVSPPLTLAANSRTSLFIGDMLQIPHCGAFHECGVVVTGRYKDIEAPYTPYLWTSTEEAMLVGREVYGMPKVMCDDTPLRWSGNQIHGLVQRRGQKLISMDFNIERRADPANVPRNASRLTVRTIPDPTGKTVSRREVLHFGLEDYEIVEAWEGRAALRILPSVMSRVHELVPADPIVSGFYLRVKWRLNTGEMLGVEES
ncbi:acetoacetate decarboxylase family protein [Bradyrhizobium sp. LHD-71]|uniref:acetoacetate decarboxylase family protein n=1 Tax=Bradyrhizobium sp. LHD-71 TaxID=3072141 RepID=UPI00280ECC85|nr:acetoacetate decarboxylase family protein [Bradyrhizobium sp. LHD-71]MDQ8727361.1 acetoacetate decarboxylase family protein [Bradyrhizobium sp. LHD-71]